MARVVSLHLYMRWQRLLRQAEAELGDGLFPYRNFSAGGAWMAEQLYQRAGQSLPSENLPDYHTAGIIKYGLASLAGIMTIPVIALVGPLAIPLSILVFYCVEVHLLFLFPLLAEGDETPYHTSVRLCRRIGVLHCVLTIIPVAIWMLTGLLNIKKPYRSWHIGCLAVIIWYLDFRKTTGYEI